MPRLFTLLFPVLLFSGCAGDNFDEASIPPEQTAAAMSFKRMADHGGIEPVIEIGQTITEWQFHVGAYRKISIVGDEPVTEYTLSDRSGITYTVSSETTAPENLTLLKTGMYGYGSGRIVSVDRNYTEGEISGTIELTDWRERR